MQYADTPDVSCGSLVEGVLRRLERTDAPEATIAADAWVHLVESEAE